MSSEPMHDVSGSCESQEYHPTKSLFGLSKRDKNKMLGSPNKKKNYAISPSKNKEVKKYKRSREREKRVIFPK